MKRVCTFIAGDYTIHFIFISLHLRDFSHALRFNWLKDWTPWLNPLGVCFAAEDEESTIEEQEAMEVASEQKEELIELTKEGQ